MDTEFEKMYKESYQSLVNYVVYSLGRKELAEDIVQETFLEAWREFDKLCDHPNIKGWLFRTAGYKMRNMVRKNRDWAMVPLEECQEEKAGEEIGFAMKEAEILVDSILTPEEELRFKRYFLWNYTVEDIAGIEGITENNARVRISRMVKKLREKIDAMDG